MVPAGLGCAGVRRAAHSLSVYIELCLRVLATRDVCTLSLRDALPISRCPRCCRACARAARTPPPSTTRDRKEHTSELQSPMDLVCRSRLAQTNPPRPTSERATTTQEKIDNASSEI